MKKSFGLFALFAILLSSCQTITQTARTADISASLQSVAVADLEVDDQRITHTMSPSKDIRRGGLSNIKQAVEYEALSKHGNADLLLEPQYVISKKRSLFGSKITSISVSGRPARYKNFRSLHDSVWSNPVFRGVKVAKRPVYRKRSYVDNNSTYGQSYRAKGFTGYIAPFLGHGMLDFDTGYVNGTQESFTMAALLGVGYQLNPHLYLGLGTGIDYEIEDGEVYIPFYANPRLYFSKKKNALFLDFKLGYSINFEDDGGLFTGWALGYSFGKVDLALQYLHQERVGEYEYRSGRYWYYEDCDVTFNQIGVSLGFRF